jgi:hypothetical protein
MKLPCNPSLAPYIASKSGDSARFASWDGGRREKQVCTGDKEVEPKEHEVVEY